MKSRQSSSREIGQIGQFLEKRGYRNKDSKYHLFDGEMFDRLINVDLPKIVNSERPIAIRIETSNTHLKDNRFESKFCKKRNLIKSNEKKNSNNFFHIYSLHFIVL